MTAHGGRPLVAGCAGAGAVLLTFAVSIPALMGVGGPASGRNAAIQIAMATSIGAAAGAGGGLLLASALGWKGLRWTRAVLGAVVGTLAGWAVLAVVTIAVTSSFNYLIVLPLLFAAVCTGVLRATRPPSDSARITIAHRDIV